MDDYTPKVCTNCGTEYPPTAEYWPKSKLAKNGLATQCKKCAYERWKQWAASNRNVLATRQRHFRENNPDKVRVSEKQSRLKNKEKYLAGQLKRSIKWQKQNQDKVQANRYRRRARQYNAEGSHTYAEVKALYEQQQGCCFHCGTDLSAGFHRDHWIPLSRGGSDWITNIRLLCPSCNRSKHDKLPHEWSDKYKESAV